MSDKNLARRAAIRIWMQGIDTTGSVMPYIKSLTYTDNGEDAADDLQIKLHDRDGLWLQRWIGEAIDAASLPDIPEPVMDDEPAQGMAVNPDPYSGWGSAIPQQEAPAGDTVYIVAKGDTLGRIASKYGTTWPELARYNNIDTPNLIFPGQEIRIPGTGATQTKETAAPAVSAVRTVSTRAASETTAVAPEAPARNVNGFAVEAVISRLNWQGDGVDKVLECGEFELDDVTVSGPPDTVTLKATSLPFTSNIRQTKKSKVWEAYRLSGIAREMASSNGMDCMFLSVSDPFFERAEQRDESDISFLAGMCRNAGISLKVTNHLIVLFDQADYESKPEIMTVAKQDVISYSLHAGTAETQYASCRVSCVDSSGKCIEGIAYVEDYSADAKNNQQLELTVKVGSAAEAKLQAEKMLRLHNKYAKTVTMTLPGDPDISAGVTVRLQGWGYWDGKYIVTQARHTVGDGYTTQLTMRRVLEGY